MPYIPNIVIAEHQWRRDELLSLIHQNYPTVEKGFVLLLGSLEQDTKSFVQESSFYYFTGVTEPGVAIVIDLEGHTTLYVPNFEGRRTQWMGETIGAHNIAKYGIDECVNVGGPCSSYQLHHFFDRPEYKALLEKLEYAVTNKQTIFTLNPATSYGYIEQRFLLERLAQWIPGLRSAIVDISPLVAQLRRAKNDTEIQLLNKAIEITSMAQEVAAHMIRPGQLEYTIQAGIEHIFIDSGAQGPSFPSIVGSGPNSTVLHYGHNNRTMQEGEVVVVDIGARFAYYCADLTRTYPVSGKFSKRQKEIYNMVLETQQYVADLAAPGYWLSNKNEPERSLNHLARAFLKKHGYDQYFLHGIGHFLGLDTHDVGDVSEPLKEGDVFTIEPGIYIAAENIGVRIEDNYWIVGKGAVCLSEQLPRKANEVEAMVGKELELGPEVEA